MVCFSHTLDNVGNHFVIPNLSEFGNLCVWSFAVMKVILVQPSSAAAEKVFSIINSSFNDSQDHALVDYIQACVMLQYNKR